MTNFLHQLRPIQSAIRRDTEGPPFTTVAKVDGRIALPLKSSYIMARMVFSIILAPEAAEDFRRLKANIRAEVRSALETHLRHEPEKVSRSRVKRLRDLRRPQYRLRVGDVRVFYDVSEATVEILAIVPKSEAESWLAQYANPE
jgi:mRNA interferase RelE/StbE